MKNQKGFTLIELLLVLAIIGIISAIAIPALLGQRETARQKATEAAAQTIKAEMVTYAEMLRKSGTPPTASAVRSAVLLMPQYTYPAAKNSYAPTGTPYTTAIAANDGEVGIVVDAAYTPIAAASGATATTYEVIKVSFKHKGVATVTESIVAIDQ